MKTKTLVIMWLAIIAVSSFANWWVVDSRMRNYRELYHACLYDKYEILSRPGLSISPPCVAVEALSKEDWRALNNRWRFDGQGDWPGAELKSYPMLIYRPAWAHLLLRRVGLRLLGHGTRHAGGNEWISWGSTGDGITPDQPFEVP